MKNMNLFENVDYNNLVTSYNTFINAKTTDLKIFENVNNLKLEFIQVMKDTIGDNFLMSEEDGIIRVLNMDDRKLKLVVNFYRLDNGETLIRSKYVDSRGIENFVENLEQSLTDVERSYYYNLPNDDRVNKLIGDLKMLINVDKYNI